MIEPILKPLPADSRTTQVIGAIDDQGLPIFLYETVLEQILEFSDQQTSQERGGFLLGGLYVDRRPYIEVRHFEPAHQAESRAASLTFTHDTWSTLQRRMESHYPEEILLGWHHTHPDFGVFLSSYDLFIHRHFFSQPWQVAMVVDPKRQEMGFFHSDPGSKHLEAKWL